MKTPNFIVIWKDRRGWFLCQDFTKIQDAIRAAEDGARRNAGDKKVPGQVFSKTLSNFSICAIPRRARFLLGDRLRKERWHRVSRATVAPHLFAENPKQAVPKAARGLWQDPKDPTLEIPNRVSLDDLGKHSSSLGVSLHPVDSALDGLVRQVTFADVDEGALAQAWGRVLRQDGPPDVSWKDGSEADSIPLLPRVVEWFSGIVWNWDHVVYTALWWTVLALLATCFFLVLTF